MRIGIISISSICLLVFFIILNTTNIQPEKVDSILEGIDYNTFSNPDVNFSSDTNLSKFIKYTGSGVINELHGTYYLVSWINTFLPKWLIENKELFIYGAIIVFCAPLIAVVLNYVILCFLALCLIIWDRIKNWKNNKNIKQKEVRR